MDLRGVILHDRLTFFSFQMCNFFSPDVEIFLKVKHIHLTKKPSNGKINSKIEGFALFLHFCIVIDFT